MDASTALSGGAMTGGGRRATDVDAAAARLRALASAVEWPDGMAGIWTGNYLAGSTYLKGRPYMAGLRLLSSVLLCRVVSFDASLTPTPQKATV
jgi:hypothetical protein